jgi:ribonuclease P protein subunit RPR2
MSFMGRPAVRRNYGKTRAAVESVAKERIEILITKAREMVEEDKDLSRRYVDLARRISERAKVRIPSELKKYLCKECGMALIPGRNAKVRLHARNTGIVITCLECGAMKRFPVTRRTDTRMRRPAMKPYIAQPVPFSKKNSNND